MARETYGETLTGWQELAASLEANTSDFPHLETQRLRLGELLKQAQLLSGQQAALTASKQEVSKQLLAVIDEGRKLASCLALLPPPAFRPATAPAELSPGTQKPR